MSMTFTRRPALLRIERIKKAMAASDMTVPQLAAAIHTSKQNAWLYMRHLKSLQEVHICGWDDSLPGPHSPVYRLGTGEDVPDFPARSWAEHSRNRRARINADPEAKDLDLAKKRAWYYRRKAEARGDLRAAPIFKNQGETLREHLTSQAVTL